MTAPKFLKFLANYVSNYLEKKDWSESQLADKAGVHRATINKALGGKDIQLSTLIKLASGLEVDLATLWIAAEGGGVGLSVNPPHQALQDAIPLLTETEAKVVLGIVQDRILGARKPSKTGTSQ